MQHIDMEIILISINLPTLDFSTSKGQIVRCFLEIDLYKTKGYKLFIKYLCNIVGKNPHKTSQ